MKQTLFVIETILPALLCLGCSWKANPSQPETPVWEQAKWSDLTPVGTFPEMKGQSLATTNLIANIYDIPADKVDRLNSLWKNLQLRGIRFTSHQAFRSNAFRIGRGDLSNWEWIQMSLAQIGAIKTSSYSLLLSEGQDTDLIIRPLPQRQSLYFTSLEQKPQQVDIGPGNLVLRLRDDRNFSQDNICQLTAYPTYALSSLPTIPKLAEEAKKNEVTFTAAGFQLRLKPEGLFVLGPEEYFGDESTLGGLFFFNKSGNIFSSPGPHPSARNKQAVRILVVVCTATHLNPPL